MKKGTDSTKDEQVAKDRLLLSHKSKIDVILEETEYSERGEQITER